jgi:hypothetical protein
MQSMLDKKLAPNLIFRLLKALDGQQQVAVWFCEGPITQAMI